MVTKRWFTGAYSRALDDKLRLAIPKPLRDCLGASMDQGLFVAPGLDESLSIYPADTFSAIAERLAQTSPNRQDVRAFSRLFYAQAQHAPLDKQGRIRLPSELVKMAALQGEVMLLGVQDHMELWDAERWQNYVADHQPRYDGLAETVFDGTSASKAHGLPKETGS